MRLWIVLALAVGLLAGCSTESSQSLFPLDEGLQWHYRVSRSDPLGNRDISSLVLTNLGSTMWDRERVFERRNGFGTHYYIQKREDGYYRVAKRRVVDQRPLPDKPPRMILPLPPRADAHWRHTTTTHLLRRIFPFSETYQHSAAIYMEFRVAAKGLKVTVPAGSYEGCVRVDGVASIQVASDARVGMSDVPLTQSEWYCPGAGLVRLTRQEDLHTEHGAIIGGQLKLELMQLDNGNPWTWLWRWANDWF